MKFRRLCTILMAILVIVMFLAGTASVGFAQDLAEYALLLGLIGHGYFGYTGLGYGMDDAATYGEIELEIEVRSDGRASGFVTATWTAENSVSHAVSVELTGVEAVRHDRNGDLEELVLNGHGTSATAGKEQAFAATVILNSTAWTADDLKVLLLDTGQLPVLPADLQIEPVEGSVLEK